MRRLLRNRSTMEILTLGHTRRQENALSRYPRVSTWSALVSTPLPPPMSLRPLAGLNDHRCRRLSQVEDLRNGNKSVLFLLQPEQLIATLSRMLRPREDWPVHIVVSRCERNDGTRRPWSIMSATSGTEYAEQMLEESVCASQEGLRIRIITPTSHFVRFGEPGGGARLASHLVRVKHDRTSSPAWRGARRFFYG